MEEARIVRPVALGIAQKGSEYLVALRIQAEQEDEGDEAITGIVQEQADGAVEIRYVGVIRPRALWHQSRKRPLLIGSSVGHKKITAGTLGAFVRDRRDDVICVLSNNHVLADENRASVGDAVIQPGRIDGGAAGDSDAADVVAKLHRSLDLDFARKNEMDAAIAILEPGIEVDPSTLTGLGALGRRQMGFVDAKEQVSKVGRTTGLTHGTVTAIELDNIAVGYDGGVAVFDNQFEIVGDNGPFSLSGDSGSVIVDRDQRAVGLLFAGNDAGVTYANYIDTVLTALDVELVLTNLVS